MDKPSTCTYCTLAEARIFDETTLSIAFKDVFPVSPGHTLIIPRRHVESYFDLTNQEREDMRAAIWATLQWDNVPSAGPMSPVLLPDGTTLDGSLVSAADARCKFTARGYDEL